MMKISQRLDFILVLVVAVAVPCAAGSQSVSPSTANQPPAAQAPKQADVDQSSEAYFDFAMGHYYQQEYEITGHAEDANKSIEFYKKAYAVDPNSQQIGDELAEIYFQSQHIRDAVLEAQSMIAKDPDNLSARRLLAQNLCPDTGGFERHFRTEGNSGSRRGAIPGNFASRSDRFRCGPVARAARPLAE